jgi:hypothetical protein
LKLESRQDSKTIDESLTNDQKNMSTKEESVKMALKEWMLSINNDSPIKSTIEESQITKDSKQQSENDTKTKIDQKNKTIAEQP